MSLDIDNGTRARHGPVQPNSDLNPKLESVLFIQSGPVLISTKTPERTEPIQTDLDSVRFWLLRFGPTLWLNCIF